MDCQCIYKHQTDLQLGAVYNNINFGFRKDTKHTPTAGYQLFVLFYALL